MILSPKLFAIVVVLVAPLSVLIPSLLEDKLTPGINGDSTWWFIGPIMYAYFFIGTVILSVIVWLIATVVFHTNGYLAVSRVVGSTSLILCIGWSALIYSNQNTEDGRESESKS